MAKKVLVGQLVDYYWDLNDTIETIEMMGNISSEEITELRNLQISLDTILTNVSKRWAKGKKDDVRNT